MCSLTSSTDLLSRVPEDGVVVLERGGTGNFEVDRGGSGVIALGHCECERADTVLGAVKEGGKTGCGCGWYD